MSLEKELLQRSNQSCELCSATESLAVYEIPPNPNGSAQQAILICHQCQQQITGDQALDANHWRCLNDSMWSETPAVQVMAYRMLHRLKESWARELIDMLYLDEETLQWAKSDGTGEEKVIHLDSNGNVLEAGDTVTLIKDLKVKGANFTAKRGTAVRRISLVQDNPEHIEGKVNGQHIVILTQYVKKSK
ncbi:MAG: PhnA domain-containing protein [Saprospiraceae bacterium]|nr:PhnA domain-containing protein [Saprospiraceae bacterium]